MNEKIDFTKFERGIFMINVVGIIYNPKIRKILIGRREKDSYVSELRWCFPGGRPAYDRDLEESLKDEIKKKTGLEIKVKDLIYARNTPEIEKQVIIYYYCETRQEKIKAGEKFVEVKWIKAREYKNYFKTSVHPKIDKFLRSLK